jgi:hypothetical protein
MANENLLSRIQTFFGFKTKKTSSYVGGVDVEPVERGSGKRLKIPTFLDAAWNWWMRELHDSSKTLNKRNERIADLSYMRYNDGIISAAAELYADESVNAESQKEVLGIVSKDAGVEKAVRQLISQWGWSQSKIRSVCDSIAFFGEGFTQDTVSPTEGITAMTPLHVTEIANRLEFSASNATKELKKVSRIGGKTNRDMISKLFDVADALSVEYSQMYEKILFGFALTNGDIVPPWAVTHFRLQTTDPEFTPWGKSLFIYTVSIFRSLLASKNLMGIARVASLPREVFKVTTENTNPAEQWMRVQEAMEQYKNFSESMQTKEEFTTGSQVWTIANSVEFSLEGGESRLGDIKDVELLRDEEIISTAIPKGYLVVDRASFGSSGQALLQQHKPFGRRVFSVQSAFLEGLTEKIKLHFMITNQFDKENTDFSLTMNFPAVEESRDRLSAKQDAFALANTIINGIKDTLGIDGPLPVEVIKSILGQLSFLTSDQIDDWVMKAYKDEEKRQKELAASDTQDVDAFEAASNFFKKLKINETIAKERLSEELIKAVVYQKTFVDTNFSEGAVGGKHIYRVESSSFTESFTRKLFNGVYEKKENKASAFLTS